MNGPGKLLSAKDSARLACASAEERQRMIRDLGNLDKKRRRLPIQRLSQPVEKPCAADHQP